MADDQKFETETMAGIYASQGHYRKAIEIYRRLLEQREAIWASRNDRP